MGFIVLLAVGGVLAWLASILTRGDDARSIALNLVAGEFGALVFGALVTRESLVLGISASALLAGIVGAIAMLVLLAVTRLRIAR
ncbi:GlsB/YeaQ/YmgE family stress response membrane protein [Tsuneonella sp. YG55]|uniref:GlsB/YeaQ/YmgE family stress response membrane protein n=1 Tax=Tsuneonella litorea TaxID=2976475 RepID=A0A9X3AK01_9SPHN|nr:GlsB/YeaQ/YmgE family stress response membrane protein [Tsuneonella litorea]MCT2557704.1 GlsB/YeaQ/YmgE family stress response membrane protein [Tsuneonella litorea]